MIIPGDPIWPGGILAGLDTLALLLIAPLIVVVLICALAALVCAARVKRPS